MSFVQKPLVLKTFIAISCLNCIVRVIQYILFETELLTSQLKSIGYFITSTDLILWIYLLLVLKHFSQKTWIYAAYILFIAYSCIAIFIPSDVWITKWIYIIVAISSTSNLAMIFANFKAKAGTVTEMFKVIALCLLAGTVIRTLAPLGLFYFNPSVLKKVDYNWFTHFLMAIAQAALIIRWAKPQKVENNLPPEEF
jgi:hypothetical protein